MGRPDFRGARGSNAGDDFHELWALRQALRLLDHQTELYAMTVEGVQSEDKNLASESWDGVDCALYFNGRSLETSTRIDLVQVKYSSADPSKAWTLSRLTASSAKKGNNSVLRRMGTAFEEARKKRSGSAAGIHVELISNQPIDASVPALFTSVANGATASDAARKARKAAGLTVDQFRSLAKAVEWRQEGSRFSLEEEILRTTSDWTEGDARPILNDLLAFMQRLMTPESAREWITEETLLAHFGFSSRDALFPCEPQLSHISKIIHRDTSSETVAAMLEGKKQICLHGVAGCGKTTALQEVQALLPVGSQMFVFDCYGGGRYLDADAYRHRDKDAFLQLSNEVAVRLRVPLFLTRSDGTDYARAFYRRLLKASEALKASAQGALLVVAVDAADNSITAAQRMVPAEGSFVRKFVAFEHLPDNVRLLVTARSGRLDQLQLPNYFHKLESTGFNRYETAQYVQAIWANAPESWIDDFHYHSHGNPRVQRYALGLKKDQPEESLAVLLPGGKVLSDVFRIQLDDARKKAGRNEPLDSFSAALTVLPHPVPVGDIAAVAGMTEAEATDICADLAPGIRFTGSGVGFADEDFEDFIRTSSAGAVPTMRARVADRLLQRHQFDGYAATHLATALHAAGRGKEILGLIEQGAQPNSLLDPILRREVRFRRLQVAMQVSSEMNDEASMLRTILVGAEAMHSAEAVFELIVKNPDLAAMFMRDSASRTLLFDARQISHHGRLLFYLVLEDARAGNAIGARATYRQLQAWLQKRHIELEQQTATRGRRISGDWPIKRSDIAADVEAVLLVAGPKAAIGALRSWNPHEAKLQALRVLTQRLICSGRGDVVERLLAEPDARDPWSLFLMVPLALAGRSIDLDRLELSLRQVYRRGWICLEKRGNSGNDDLPDFWLDTILTGCEVLVGRGRDPKHVLPLLRIFASETHRQIDTFYTHNTTRIDLQLRALALLYCLEGRRLGVDDFLITPPTPTKAEEPRGHVDAQHRQRATCFVSPLVATYDARAQLIVGKGSANERAQLLTEVGQRLDGYDFSRIHESFEMRRKAGRSVAYLRCIPTLSTSELLDRTLNLFGERPGSFGGDELAILPLFVSEPSLHSKILSVISSRVSDITTTRTVASEKIEAVLEICRFVANISHDEAAALFSEAHKMSEDVDIEAIHLLRAMAAMGVRAATILDPDKRRLACQHLHSRTTDASVRLANQEGFPWDSVVEALGQLDLPVALAAIGRWQDSATEDLDSTLSSLLAVCLRTNQISTELAVALLPLLQHASKDLLHVIATKCAALSAGVRASVVEELARDAILRFDQVVDVDLDEKLCDASVSQGQGPWLGRLQKTLTFLRRDDRVHKTPRQEHERFTSQTKPSIQLPVESRFVSPNEITSSVKREVDRLRLAEQFIPASDVLDAIRSVVPVADRVLHLNALAAIGSEEISDYVAAEAIYSALNDPEWVRMASIRRWCRERLSDVIIDRLPGFAHGFGYGGHPPLPPLLVMLAAEGKDIPTLLARAIGAHVDDLNATVVYELVRLIVAQMGPEACGVGLMSHLERVQKRIPPVDLDQIPVADVPRDAHVAVARFLRALMSDCDIRLRWRAAHSIRRLAIFKLKEEFDAWVYLYDATSEQSFRAANEPFYWLAARLWSVIALHRVAYETPEALTKHFGKLVDIATDESLPHVLIRGFAKDGALHLRELGDGKLTAKRQKQLVAVNTSSLPRALRDWGRRRGDLGEKIRFRECRFDFDHMDTVRYWYHSAIDVFVEVSQDEFLNVAEKWILDKWRVPTTESRWELQPRKYRFSERNWTESSNDHGTEPTLERFTTYLERHAMFCAVGELMKSKPLVSVTDDGYDHFEAWLKRRGLSSPPQWLADFRGLKPLEGQFWSEPSDMDTWLEVPADSEFLRELLTHEDGNMITAQAWHETGSSRFSSRVYVDSALVEPTAAASLMRALQTATDPYDYKLPDEGTDFEINEPPYRLLGWMDDITIDSGIDSKDPFCRTIAGVRLRPGAGVGKDLVQRITSDGNVAWNAMNQSVAFEHTAWSDKPPENRSERRRYRLESEGERLSVSVKTLLSWMFKTEMDLIVSIKFIREEGSGDYEETSKEKRKARTAKIIILRRDGSIETCNGRIGTWQIPGRRA